MWKEDEELANNLQAAGNALLSSFPISSSSVDQLLILLHRVEKNLLEVKQSPSNSVQKALNPTTKALSTKELLNHSNVDIQVYVAICTIEVLRITAPDAPYGDDQMKEIFKLIVAALDNISDNSSPLYQRRVSILTTFTKIRLWVVMLDLQLHSLILEIFQLFLTNIRENHPDAIFMSMGYIMIMILEEVEEISPELLSPILSSVRKGNQSVRPIAQKLGERVIENCISKLVPYMHRTVQHMGFPLDDYGKLVAYICAQNFETLDESKDHDFRDSSSQKHLAKKRSCNEEIDNSSSVNHSPKTGNVCSQQWRGRKTKGRGQINCKKNLNGEFSAREMIRSAKSDNGSSVNESNVSMESPTEKSKGNPRKEKTCLGRDDREHYGENLIGSKIKVQCAKQHASFEGDIVSCDPVEKKHKVQYTDGNEKALLPRKEQWEFVGDESSACRGKLANLSTLEVTSGMHQNKKLNMKSKTMRSGGISTTESDVKISSSNNSKSVENEIKSENRTSEVGNTDTKSAIESMDGIDRVCSVPKKSAVGNARKSKDDSLKSRTMSKDDITKTVMELPLRNLIPQKLKKIRSPRHQMLKGQKPGLKAGVN